jgi:hypothetical protein
VSEQSKIIEGNCNGSLSFPTHFWLLVASYHVLDLNYHPIQVQILLGTALQLAPHSSDPDASRI